MGSAWFRHLLCVVYRGRFGFNTPTFDFGTLCLRCTEAALNLVCLRSALDLPYHAGEGSRAIGRKERKQVPLELLMRTGTVAESGNTILEQERRSEGCAVAIITASRSLTPWAWFTQHIEELERFYNTGQLMCKPSTYMGNP